MVANADIRTGTLILSDSPIVIAGTVRSNESIKDQFDKLSSDQQRHFSELANSHPELPEYLGIFETNALPLDFTEPGRGEYATNAAIFPQGTRFNHSCVPNVSHNWATDDNWRDSLLWLTLKKVTNYVSVTLTQRPLNQFDNKIYIPSDSCAIALLVLCRSPNLLREMHVSRSSNPTPSPWLPSFTFPINISLRASKR